VDGSLSVGKRRTTQKKNSVFTLSRFMSECVASHIVDSNTVHTSHIHPSLTPIKAHSPTFTMSHTSLHYLFRDSPPPIIYSHQQPQITTAKGNVKYIRQYSSRFRNASTASHRVRSAPSAYQTPPRPEMPKTYFPPVRSRHLAIATGSDRAYAV
jgi:hypothetical protein